jgi:hypothetical protein
MRLRLVIVCCALVLVVLVGPSAFADSFTYTTAGSTFGSSGTSTAQFLDFITPGQVDATLAFNSTSAGPVSSGSTISLGSFNFSILSPCNSPQSTCLGFPGAGFLFADSFTLQVAFSVPANSNGSPFLALVTGNVFVNAGGATITFAPTSQLFTSPTGNFTLSLNLNPIQVSSANTPVSLKAMIVAVPEGAGIPMLGLTGMLLLGAITMKRAIS